MKTKFNKLKSMSSKNTNIVFIVIMFLIICGIVVMAKSKAEANNEYTLNLVAEKGTEVKIIKTNNLPSENAEVENIESTEVENTKITKNESTNTTDVSNTSVETQNQITDLNNNEEQSIADLEITADSLNEYSNSSNDTIQDPGEIETGKNVTIYAEPKTGYSFSNWTSSDTSKVADSDEQTYTFTMPNADITMTANATPKTYTITLNQNGATVVGTESVNVDYDGTELSTKITNPTKEKKAFRGWSLTQNSDDILIDENGNFVKGNTTYISDDGKWIYDGNVTLYAYWTDYIMFDISKGAITIGASYSGKDSSGATVSGTHQHGNQYYITQADPNTKTTNTITFNQNSEDLYEVILDNVNMGASSYGTAQPGIYYNSPSQGEININASSNNTKNIIIKLKNENILRAIRYHTDSNTKSKLKITSFDGDGSTEGKLYIPERKVTQEEIDELVNSNTNYNHWHSGIGGYNSKVAVRGLTIAGGDIQVLTSSGDNCTAIGGGGNRLGEVTITGGKVKAIANGTGTAIGGGIGWNSPGGEGNITITGGKVFASNYGYGVAIGGGSAYNSDGSIGTVNITGGNVTVTAAGKTAIGGGNSTNRAGGDANINISGGTVKATAIGSGYGIDGYKTSKVTIVGGSINSLISTQPTNGSESVHLTRATIYESDETQPNISISSLEGLNNYGLNDVKTDNNGTLHLWIPNGKEITGAIDSSGTEYTGSIATKAVGMLHHNSSKNYYSVRCSYNNDITLYTGSDLTSSFSGSLTAASGTNVSFWVKANKYNSTNYYSLTAYKSNADNTMSVLTPEEDSDLSNGLYHYTLMLDTNRDVWFETSDGTTNRLSLDLILGNVILSNNNVIIGGYTLSNYTGKYNLTSGGISTENTLFIESGTHEVIADRLVIDTNNNAIRIEGGTLNLSSSSYENSMKSDTETIHLYNGSNLNLIDTGGSLKLETTKNNTSSIGGDGNVNITKNAGFLNIIAKGTASQITARNYTYKLAKNISNTVLPYSVTLSGRTMIGYSSSYSGTRKMYDKSQAHTASSGAEFKAIGAEYVDYVEGSTITPSISDDNNAIFTIQNTPSTAYVENGGNILTKDTDYTFTKSGTTGTLEVQGTSITDHLIVAVVDEQELAIVIDSVDQTYEYDGKAHSIDVKVIWPRENVTIQYSTDNINWQEESIEYTDPGIHTIYWKVSAEGYIDKTGSNKVTIGAAPNYWTKALTIKSLRLGETPNPNAEAKWGTETIIYEYSTSPNDGFENKIPKEIGGYYVRARIEEKTGLYEGLVSDAVRFYIEPTAVYIKDLYTMDKLTTFEGIAPSVTGAVSHDKSFSVLYNFLYIPDKDKGNYLTINFSENIPIGTKIALVDFSEGDNIVDAYYYKAETETNSIASNKFKQMGSSVENTFEKGINGEVYSATYQILVQFPESNTLSDNITMNLSHDGEIITASDITIDTTTSNLNGNVELNNVVSSNEKVTANARVTSTTTKSNYKNVLAISLYKSDGTTPISFSPSTIVKIGDKETNIRANIATIEGITNSTYPIEISGLQNGEYKIEISISAGNSEMLSAQFPMNHVKDSKISNSFTITNPEYGIRANIVSRNDNDRVVNVSEKAKTVVISLKYTALNTNTNPTLTTSIQKKNNNLSFSNLSSDELKNWNISKPSLTTGTNRTTEVSITIPKGQANGAYLVNFKIGNAVCTYCIVVDNGS